MEEKATRRRLSEDERIARARSQIEMIEKRKASKSRDRVVEALGLLAPLAETDSTIRDVTGVLAGWLKGVS